MSSITHLDGPTIAQINQFASYYHALAAPELAQVIIDFVRLVSILELPGRRSSGNVGIHARTRATNHLLVHNGFCFKAGSGSISTRFLIKLKLHYAPGGAVSQRRVHQQITKDF